MATLNDTKSAIQAASSACAVWSGTPAPPREAIVDNELTTGLVLKAPFGGFKESSANTFMKQGQAAVDFYTCTTTIYVNHG